MGDMFKPGLRTALASLTMGGALTASVLASALPASATMAVTLYVAPTGTNSRNNCKVVSKPCATIQHAVTRAVKPRDNGDNVTIDLAPGTYDENGRPSSDAEPISASSLASLTIAGSAASTTTVSAQNASSVFTIEDGSVTISGLTITGGNTPEEGGGVDNVAGIVTLTNDSIVDNTAGGGGGGVSNFGTVTLTGDTVAGNLADNNSQSAPGVGGGLGTGEGTATLTNDTFFANGAWAEGGGIVDGPGTLSLTDVTFSNNSVFGEFGLGSDIAGDGDVSATNSVLDDSASCLGTVTDGGYNVEVDDSCGFGATSVVDSSTIDLASNLAPNGSSGPETLAIGPNSSAYKEVPKIACTPMIDERGDPRPGVPGRKCDAGAYEYQAPAAATTSALPPGAPPGDPRREGA
jgi:hypothetical protein